MFDTLVESLPRRSARSRTVPGAMLSLALHAGAILSLIHVTRPGAAPLPPIALDAPIVFPGPPRPPDVRDDPTAGTVGRLPITETQAVPVVPVPFTVPDGIAPVDAGGVAPRWTRRALPGSIFESAGGGEPRDVFTLALVDEPPVRLFSPPIDYPAALSRAGIAGVVLVEAVVDTLGTVEPGSLRVIESEHPGLNDSARRVVERSRFRPGRIRGRPVRVVVRLPVVFRLGEG